MGSRFHNKFHRQSHHTNATPGNPDSASDPIASPSEPFQGNFVVQGQISATSIVAAGSGYLPLAGGTMQGDIDMNNFGITNANISAENIRVTNLVATSATIHYQDIIVSELSGFIVQGEEADLTVPQTITAGQNNVTLDGVGLSGNRWASFDGDLQTKNNLIVSGVVNVPNGTSNNWNTAYSTALANQDDIITNVAPNTGNWDTAYNTALANQVDITTNVSPNSANWNSVYTSVSQTSGDWDNAYATVSGGAYGSADDIEITYSGTNYTEVSANISGHYAGIDNQLGTINADITNIAQTSGDWNTAYGTVSAGNFTTADPILVAYPEQNYTAITSDVSGHLEGIDNALGSVTSNQDDITNIAQTSANWNAAYAATSGGEYSSADRLEVTYSPNSYTALSANISGHYAGIDVVLGSITSNQGDITNIAQTSANWDSTYTSVSQASANWNTAYATVSDASYGGVDNLDIDYSATNYTATSANVSGHFAGIDNYIGNVLVNSIDVTLGATGTIVSIPSATYDGAFIDLVLRSGNNIRATNVMIAWTPLGVEFTDTATADIGDTSAITLSAGFASGAVELQGIITSSIWDIRGEKRLIEV